ncbi:MAG: hypothetical protein ACM33T_08250 [Solirubrobacterales bacterium]
MTKRSLAAILSAAPVAAALLLAGCNGSTSLPPAQAGDGQQSMDFGLLTDIPIPSGATMDNERSLILGAKDRWTGRVVMKLWKNAAEANQFYQQQMPAFGWEPVMAATSGTSVHAYTRADRAATVQIDAGQMWGSTVVVIVADRHGSGSVGGMSGGGAYDIPAARPERVRAEPLGRR